MRKDRQRRFVWIASGALGDALMVLSAAMAVKASEAGSEIFILATSRLGALQTLVGDAPIRIRPFSVSFLNTLVFGGYRTTVFMPTTFGTLPAKLKLFAFFLSAFGARTIGFLDQGDWHPYTRTLAFDTSQPILSNLVAQARTGGISVGPIKPRILFEPVFHAQKKPYIIIHPFAANLKRSLPPRRWRSLISWILGTYPELAIFITGAGKEAVLAQELFGDFERLEFVMDEPLPELAGRLVNALLYVGVDTGVTHLAAVCGVQSVVLENRSNPLWFPDYSPNTMILYSDGRCTCTGDKKGDCTVIEDGKPYFRCLYDIPDEEIQGAIANVLNRVIPLDNPQYHGTATS